jgi:methylmalonyl-CoA mutase
VAFGLDPYAASAFGPFPADWGAHLKPFVGAALALRARGFARPLVVADARSVHAAGGAPAQELAFALGAAVGLLRALNAAGLPLDEARERIAFRLAADADEFVTLSKFRALRLLWARIEQACGLEERPAYVQAESAWRMMTARDPYVNVMRGTMAAFSAGLGGADSVSVLPHTLAVGLPDSLARRLARTGQLILLRESHLGFVADPAAGAGAFEALTGALCDKGWTLFQEIEAGGGLAAVLKTGALQRQVAESATALRRDIARLKSPITGVSAHADLGERRAETAPGAPERGQPASADGALAPMRLAEPFEVLRAQSDAILETSGARPKVFLIALGPEPSHRRRVGFVRDWLEAGGIEPVYDSGAGTPGEVIRSLRAAGASLACLCGDDVAYAAHGAAFAAAIRTAGVKGLILAGRPRDREAELRGAGVDAFVFAGGDAVAALQELYRRLARSGAGQAS